MDSISILYNTELEAIEIRKQDGKDVQSIYQTMDEALGLLKFLNTFKQFFNEDDEYWIRFEVYLNTRPTVLYGLDTGEWVIATQVYGEEVRRISFTSEEMKILIRKLTRLLSKKNDKLY